MSFAPLKNDEKKKIYTVPPLLRSVIKEMKTSNEGFWLAYLTHYRLADEIAVWHLHNPEVKIDCFWDHPEIKEFVKCKNTEGELSNFNISITLS